MPSYPRKRKSNVLGWVDCDEDRALKTSRTTGSLSPQSFSTGQRFGESVDFIPLNELSQVPGADEEDAEATEIVENSQDADESSLASNFLYGSSHCISLLGFTGFDSDDFQDASQQESSASVSTMGLLHRESM